MHRRQNRRVECKEREELFGVLRNATADHNEVWAEQEFDVRVERLQTLCPGIPRQVFSLFCGVRSPALDRVPIVLEVAKLSVWHEHAVVQESGADAGAERGENDEAVPVAGGAVAGLGDASGIRIVCECDVAAEAVFEELLGLEPDPVIVRPCLTIAGKATPSDTR